MAVNATTVDVASHPAVARFSDTISTGNLVAGTLVLLLFSKWVSDYRKTAKVPAVGYALNGYLPFLSTWVGAIRFMRAPVEVARQGYAKFKKGMFRISTLQGEYVLVSERDKIAEYMRAPDDIMSMQDAANDAQQIPYTLGYGVAYRTYHTPVVRVQLTQSIKSHITPMLNEIDHAFNELIGNSPEYQPIPLYQVMAMTTARTSNRVYVGTKFSRNKEYIKMAVDYAEAVVVSSEIIRPFPEWSKNFLVKFCPIEKYRRASIGFLKDLVEERMNWKVEEKGDKPDDLVQWLVDAAPPIERTMPQLVERIMSLNVASIHTTTMTFSGALYSLAAEPEKYLPALRAEVKEHCIEGQITKETLTKLTKMDSFLREAGRFNNAGLLAMQRNAKKDFKFSDGTVIPAGAKVGTPSLFVHRDRTIYENPDEFDGFRFSRLREKNPGAEGVKNTMVSTDPAYQVFGHGKHACPGRFFAVNEMKLILSTLIMRYDIKMIPGTKPEPFFIGTLCLPDTKLKVLLKRIQS